jgi:hypothetical protein
MARLTADRSQSNTYGLDIQPGGVFVFGSAPNPRFPKIGDNQTLPSHEG